MRPFFYITILLAQNHNHNETFLSYYPTMLAMQPNGSRKGLRFLLLEVPLGRTQQLKYSHTHCFYFSPKYFIVHLLLFSHFKGYVYPYELFSDGRLFWELWSPFHCVECHLQSITVTDFVATENAIVTVEYLLNKATTLDKLMIATSSSHAYITIN